MSLRPCLGRLSGRRQSAAVRDLAQCGREPPPPGWQGISIFNKTIAGLVSSPVGGTGQAIDPSSHSDGSPSFP